jgi:hypothetical protein
MEDKGKERYVAITTCQGIKGMDPVSVQKRTGELWWLTAVQRTF